MHSDVIRTRIELASQMIGRICFTRDIALGSLLTIAVVMASATVGGVLYVGMERRVAEANVYQKDNREKIDEITAAFAAYRLAANDHALFLTKQLEAMRVQIDQLRRDVGVGRYPGN